VTTQR